jgi:HemY protein
MIRFAMACIIVLAIGAGAAWLAGHSGVMALEVGNVRIETRVVTAAAVVALLVLAAVILHHAWRWLWRGPGHIGASRAARRRREGYLALTRGMVAVAAGDAQEAKRYAAEAARRLHEPPLTLLLSAQAAQLAGDEPQAERHFTAMLERAETEFLGLRGLLAQAVRKGDRQKALALAERARAIRPNTPWLLRELFALQTAESQWGAAEATLAQAVKSKALPLEETRHRRAVLIFQRAETAAKESRQTEALKLAEQALALAPEFTPAAVLAAQLQQARGKPKKAQQALIQAWNRMPHPELAEAYLSLHGTTEPATRLTRVGELIAERPEHPESRLIMARAAIAAGALAQARQQLEALRGDRPPGATGPRVAKLMAELDERQYGDGASAREWLLRATAAAPDPAWSCGQCGWQATTWSIRCPSCGAFDSLQWRDPTAGAPPLLTQLPSASPSA